MGSLHDFIFSQYSGFLPQLKDVHVKLAGKSKLGVGVNESENGCLSLCVSPAIVYLASHSIKSWDRGKSQN